MNNLIPIINEFPTKTEIKETLKNYLQLETLNILDKFLVIKTLENIVKESSPLIDKQKIIEFILETNGGDTNILYKGLNIKITKETITKTMAKYEFSDKVNKMSEKIELKKSELKMLEDQLKSQKTHEINSEIAVNLKQELTGEEDKPVYGLVITFQK